MNNVKHKSILKLVRILKWKMLPKHEIQKKENNTNPHLAYAL